MNLPENERKEGISYGLLHAIASNAGYTLSKPEKDKGVDARINHIMADEIGHTESGVGIDVQLKSTDGGRIHGNVLKYTLDADYNNRIAARYAAWKRKETLNPIYLMVYHCSNRRLEHSSHEIKVTRGFFYFLITEATTNTRSVTLNIPLTQFVTEQALHDIFTQTHPFLGNFT